MGRVRVLGAGPRIEGDVPGPDLLREDITSCHPRPPPRSIEFET